MILGLCSSFAMVPALSMVTGGMGATRRTVGPAARPGGAGDVTDPVSLAAILTSDASLSAVLHGLANPALPAPAPARAAGPAGARVANRGGAPAAVVVPPAAVSRGAVTPPAGAPVAVLAPGGHSQQGVASWLDIAAGTCANNAAPMGVVITVTSRLGVTVTCRVVSRGPFGAGRIVDLARGTFAALQLPSMGLVDVAVSW